MKSVTEHQKWPELLIKSHFWKKADHETTDAGWGVQKPKF